MGELGLYIHVPFCASKCGYCDFYSFPAEEAVQDAYTEAVCRDLAAAGARLGRKADTLYFGGGTPSLLGGARLVQILSAARAAFDLEGAEITLEANPADDLAQLLTQAAEAGVNRLSLGVQSGVASELAVLGRRHTNADVVRTVADARAAGISNLSLDLMLGIPGQTPKSLTESVHFLLAQNPNHLSAYLLKIEPGTPFARRQFSDLPGEDEAAALYLQTVKALEAAGLRQYEISNFARPGCASRHNTKYWTGADYLGFGPAAHSFFGGGRFYYPRDLEAYLAGAAPVQDGAGGGLEETVMLRLRLTEGIRFAGLQQQFGFVPNRNMQQRMEWYAKAGYALLDESHFALTPKGFLVSNAIIGALLAEIESL